MEGQAFVTPAPDGFADFLPGIFSGIEFETYKKLPGMNASTLKWGLTTMEHLKAAIDGLITDEESPDKKLGRAIHARLLEPHLYASDWQTSMPCQAKIKSGDRKGQDCGNTPRVFHNGEWLCGLHGPESTDDFEHILSLEQSIIVNEMGRRVYAHPVVKLLRQHGGCEVTVMGQLDGIDAKCRTDKLIIGQRCPDTIVDIKSCRRGYGSTWAFSSQVKSLNYDMKAAYYVDLVHAVTGRECAFIWLVVEKELPFCVNTIRADEETLEIGRFKYRQVIADYKRCLKSGTWPGYSDDIQLGGLPEREREFWRRQMKHAQFDSDFDLEDPDDGRQQATNEDGADGASRSEAAHA